MSLKNRNKIELAEKFTTLFLDSADDDKRLYQGIRWIATQLSDAKLKEMIKSLEGDD